jgi:hypothetical protein
VQIPWKQTLGLVAALSVVSCGDSESTGDKFQGYIDWSVLDTKFRQAQCGGSAACYQPQTVTVNNDPVVVYNLGLVANPDTTKAKPPPAVVADSLATSVYEFPDGCQAGKAYDPRTDAFEETKQYPIFTRLPLANTSSSAPAVVPLVKVIQWKGSGAYTCNALKSATTIDKGEYNLEKQEGFTVALRAVVGASEVRRANGTQYIPPLGWYKGLLLNYLDAGQVALEQQPVGTDGALVDVLKPMDGVIVNPPTGTSAVTANNVIVLFARPGEVGWSPVVRLREFTATTGTTPASYRSLCYDAPCPAGTVPMNGPGAASRYAGTLFLTTGAP